MLGDELCIHFGYIAQEVSSGIVRILPDASCLTSESRELICHLGKSHIGFLRYLFDHHHGTPSYS